MSVSSWQLILNFQRTTLHQQRYIWAGVHVYWLWEETHVLKAMGSNPSTMY